MSGRISRIAPIFAFIVAIGTLTSGCKQSKQISKDIDSDEKSIGRYQIIDDPRHDGVFWIDTAKGEVQQCQWTELDKGSWRCFTVKSE